jgi:acyl carrier protein
MEKELLLDKLKEVVRPYVQDQQAFEVFTEDTDFINDLKINSANLIDIVLDIEDAFDIEIDNEAMEQMLNVNKAVDIIQSRIK